MNCAAAAISAASRAPLGLFSVLAPTFDLEALVELRGGKGLARIKAPHEQCQGDDQRATGRGRRMECGQREIVVRGDRIALRSIVVPARMRQRHRFPANVALRIPLSRDRHSERQTRYDQIALCRRLDEPTVESNAVTASRRHGSGLLVEPLHAERSTNGFSTSSGKPKNSQFCRMWRGAVP
jgi:hypothetical protein